MANFRTVRLWARRWMPCSSSLRFYRAPLFLSLLLVSLICYYIRQVETLPIRTAAPNPIFAPPENARSIPGPAPRSFVDLISELYAPLIPAPDAPVVRVATGAEYTLNATESAHWKTPLGRNLCIVDIDNRPFNSTHQFLHPGPLEWNKFHWYGFGVLNHWIYARIHNYSYHFIRTSYPDRFATWSKIRGLQHLLSPSLSSSSSPSKLCAIIVVADSDAIFSNLHLPLEWLLNRWGVTADTSLALAADPPLRDHLTDNLDRHGRPNLNTGFMIVQGSASRTRALVRAIAACVDEDGSSASPGCAAFRWRWPHEQGALSSFVRNAFADAIVQIPCDEANGWPREEGGGEVMHNDGCGGVFVQHNWYRKEELGRIVATALAVGVLPRMHGEFLEQRADVVRVFEEGVTSGVVG